MCVSVYGPQDGWADSHTLATAAAAIVFTLLFLFQESRAAEPILPLNLFKNHTFSLTSAMAFIIGAGMFGAIIMLPLYFQLVRSNTATIAGLKLIPFMIGIVSTSVISGKLISKHGHYKRYPIGGLLMMAIGVLALSTINETTPYWKLSIYELMVGMGLGLSMQTIVIALQNSVDFKDMGVATSANTFFRSIGGTIGVALFGSVYSNRLAHYLGINIQSLAATNPAAMAGATPAKFAELKNNSAVIKDFSPELQASVYHSFVQSFHVVFLAAAPVVFLGFILSLFLREVPLRTGAAHHAAQQEAAGEAMG